MLTSCVFALYMASIYVGFVPTEIYKIKTHRKNKNAFNSDRMCRFSSYLPLTSDKKDSETVISSGFIEYNVYKLHQGDILENR